MKRGGWRRNEENRKTRPGRKKNESFLKLKKHFGLKSDAPPTKKKSVIDERDVFAAQISKSKQVSLQTGPVTQSAEKDETVETTTRRSTCPKTARERCQTQAATSPKRHPEKNGAPRARQSKTAAASQKGRRSQAHGRAAAPAPATATGFGREPRGPARAKGHGATTGSHHPRRGASKAPRKARAHAPGAAQAERRGPHHPRGSQENQARGAHGAGRQEEARQAPDQNRQEGKPTRTFHVSASQALDNGHASSGTTRNLGRAAPYRGCPVFVFRGNSTGRAIQAVAIQAVAQHAGVDEAERHRQTARRNRQAF